jgi:biotin transport system substrate-specific component
MADTAAHSQTLYRSFAPALPARRTVAILAGSLFIALCAHISVPLFFTPVPMTLQPFAVLLVGLLFGPALGAATCAVYLAEGAAGLPVFTPQGAGGLLQLFGPTGGYLLSYPAAAALAGAIAQAFRHQVRRFEIRLLPLGAGALLGALAANALILLSGASWLSILTHQSAATVARAAVLPFLPGDALKVVLAALLASAWYRTRVDATDSNPAA